MKYQIFIHLLFSSLFFLLLLFLSSPLLFISFFFSAWTNKSNLESRITFLFCNHSLHKRIMPVEFFFCSTLFFSLNISIAFFFYIYNRRGGSNPRFSILETWGYAIEYLISRWHISIAFRNYKKDYFLKKRLSYKVCNSYPFFLKSEIYY